MSTISNGGLRDTSQVWSCWRGCLCLLCTLQHAHGWPGEQLCPARQPAHTHDAACWCSSTVQPDMSRCVTKSRSAFPKPEPVRGLPQSPGPRMSPQGPVPGQPLWQWEPCGCSPCCMPSMLNTHRPAQLSKVPSSAAGPFRCGFPSCQCALTSTPLVPGTGEAEGECLTNLVFKATTAVPCDSLVGQAVVTSREGIRTSPQWLDTILLPSDNL